MDDLYVYWVIQFLRGLKKDTCPIDSTVYEKLFNSDKSLLVEGPAGTIHIDKKKAIRYLLERFRFNVVDGIGSRIQTDFNRPAVYNRETGIRSVYNR